MCVHYVINIVDAAFYELSLISPPRYLTARTCLHIAYVICMRVTFLRIIYMQHVKLFLSLHIG